MINPRLLDGWCILSNLKVLIRIFEVASVSYTNFGQDLGPQYAQFYVSLLCYLAHTQILGDVAV